MKTNNMKENIYSAPEVEVMEIGDAMQSVFCNSGQTSKYNPDGDTEGWF